MSVALVSALVGDKILLLLYDRLLCSKSIFFATFLTAGDKSLSSTFACTKLYVLIIDFLLAMFAKFIRSLPVCMFLKTRNVKLLIEFIVWSALPDLNSVLSDLSLS